VTRSASSVTGSRDPLLPNVLLPNVLLPNVSSSGTRVTGEFR
jgi:hypothetical protein